MLKKLMIATVAVICLARAAGAEDAKSVLAAAAKAMGADSLNSLAYSGPAATSSLGQAGTPNGPWPMFTISNYTCAMDLSTGSLRATGVRKQTYPIRGGGGQPIADGPFNQNITFNADSPWAQQLDYVLTPFGFLKTAAASPSTLRTVKIRGKKYSVVSFNSKTKAPSGRPYTINGYIDDRNILHQVESWLDNPVLGDMHVEAVFSDYKDYAGVKFPSKVVQSEGGHPVFTLEAVQVTPNPPDIQQLLQPPPGGQRGGGPRGGGAPGTAPGSASRGGGPGQGGPTGQPPATSSRKLGDGVYLITGGYRGVAVEFKDYVVVIEGAQNEARAEAVIAETKKLIPGKPIRYTVNTHHHFDHAQGLRAFVAEGAAIITYKTNRSFYEKAYATSRTLLTPDKMSRSRIKARFMAIGEKRVLQDSANILELYHIASPHDDGMLIAYLPKLKLIVESDLVNGPPRPNPFEIHLAKELERLKLDYAAFVPAHQPNPDQEVPKAELMKRVAEAAQREQPK